MLGWVLAVWLYVTGAVQTDAVRKTIWWSPHNDKVVNFIFRVLMALLWPVWVWAAMAMYCWQALKRRLLK